jgi:hypothetical protein
MIPGEYSLSIMGKMDFFFLKCFKNQIPARAKFFLFFEMPMK